MQGSMHVSGTYSWKNQGAGGGVLVFEGGHRSPCQGVGSTLPSPASLPAAVRLNDLVIGAFGIDHCSFPVLFPRNVEPHRVGFENRRDLGEFLTGGWSHNSNSRCFFRPHFAGRPPCDGYPPGRGGGPPMRGEASLMRQRGRSTHRRDILPQGVRYA